MKTKNFFKELVFCTLALGLTTGFSACSDDDDPTSITLPALTGNLTLSIPENEIGAGQTFTVGYTLPAQHEGVATRTCELEITPAEGGVADPVLNGNEFTQRIYLKKAGEYTLRLNIANTLAAPNPDGSTQIMQQIEKKVSVIATDIYYSFWGENMERTKQNNGLMKLEKEQETLLDYTYPSQLLQMNPVGGKPSAQTSSISFRYTNNALSSVIESTPYNVTKPGDFVASAYTMLQHLAEVTEITEQRMWLLDTDDDDACNALLDQWIANKKDMGELAQLGELLAKSEAPGVTFGFTDANGRAISLTLDFTNLQECEINISWNK